MKITAVAACGLLALSSVVGAASAGAAAVPPISSFTVVTTFGHQTSDIIEADGLWSDCWGVRDLTNYANQVSPTKVQFSGEKKVLCDSGDVVIHYDAEMNFRSGQGLTFGTFSVVSSRNSNISGGAGTVSGDPRGCDECIVDTFSGRIY